MRALGGFLPHTEGAPPESSGRRAALRRRRSEAVAQGHRLHPRERRIEGLVMFLSVAENISLGDLRSVMRGRLISHRRGAPPGR